MMWIIRYYRKRVRRFTHDIVTRIFPFSLKSCSAWQVLPLILFIITFVTFAAFKTFHNSSKELVQDVGDQFYFTPGKELNGSARAATLCPPFQKESLKRVIFIEASGHICLSPRDICGIESAARANPDMRIDVFFHIGPTFPVHDHKSSRDHHMILNKKKRSCSLTVDILKKTLPNVRIHREDLIQKYLMDSPFQRLIADHKQHQFNESCFRLLHTIDALKLVLLNKFGGIYLDTNFITLGPLHCLANSMTFDTVPGDVWPEVKKHLCSGLMSFEKAHPFLEKAMNYLVDEYEPYWRESIGGIALAEAFQLYCSRNISAGMFDCDAGPIRLIPPERFFPVERQFIPVLFSSKWVDYSHKYYQFNLSKLDDSFTAYIYGSQWGLPVHPDSLYAAIAKAYCPATWSAVQDDSPSDF